MEGRERKNDYSRLLSQRRQDAYRALNLPTSMAGGGALMVEFVGQGELSNGILALVGVGFLGLCAYMNAKLIQHGRAVRRLRNRNTEAPFTLPSQN